MKRIFVMIIVLLSAIELMTQPALSNSIIDARVKSIEDKLNVTIIYNRFITDTWKGSAYTIPLNENLLLRYLGILEREYSKYPEGFFLKARANKLVLTEKYSFRGNKQAAMPDPYGNRLYLAIDGAYGNKSEKYLVHVMHHELNHCTEYALWKNQHYRWSEWSALTPAGFTYGTGGVSAYRKKGIDYYQLSHPHEGFLNLYSMTAQEEDRSEIIAVIMSDIERPILHKYCKTDPLLRRKVRKLITHLNNFAGVSGENSYWESKNKICYSEQ